MNVELNIGDKNWILRWNGVDSFQQKQIKQNWIAKHWTFEWKLGDKNPFFVCFSWNFLLSVFSSSFSCCQQIALFWLRKIVGVSLTFCFAEMVKDRMVCFPGIVVFMENGKDGIRMPFCFPLGYFGRQLQMDGKMMNFGRKRRRKIGNNNDRNTETMKWMFCLQKRDFYN